MRSAGASRPQLARRRLGLHVDVEQDFRVVADEPDRDDEETPRRRRAARCADEVAQVRTDPRLRRSARALIGETIPRDARRVRRRLRAVPRLRSRSDRQPR